MQGRKQGAVINIRPEERTEQVGERLKRVLPEHCRLQGAWEQEEELGGDSNPGEQSGADQSRERDQSFPSKVRQGRGGRWEQGATVDCPLLISSGEEAAGLFPS